MKVLAVTTMLPMPQNHGDALRSLMMLKHLASVSELTIVSVKRPDSRDDDVADLRAELPTAAIEIFSVDPEPMDGVKRKFSRAVRAIAKRSPPWTLGQLSSPAVARVSEIAHAVDVIVLIGEAAGLYLPKTRAVVVWDKSNVLSSSTISNAWTLRAPRQRLAALLNWPAALMFERRTLAQCDFVWVTSSDEARRLLAFQRVGASAVIRSAVTVAKVPSVFPVAESPTILWMSTLSYPPNWDGLVRLLRVTSGSFEAQGLKLRVVGAGASDEQKSYLRKFSAVDFVGYVDDLAAASENVRFAVVPIWSGAGVKLKTLTLMGMGVPVVATPVALEGIPRDAALAVADSPEDFARLLSAPAPSQQELLASRANALSTLESFFSGPAFSRAVEEAFAEVRNSVHEVSR